MNASDVPLNIVLLFGGRSCEHAVSVTSAKSLIAAIPDSVNHFRYIGISEQGSWRWADQGSIDSIVKDGRVDPLAGLPVVPDLNHSGRFIDGDSGKPLDFSADVLFPLLHGPYGEDGTIQGLFDMYDIPYVGCGVAASACGMDKLLSKRLFEKAGIPQADYIEVRRQAWLDNAVALQNQIKNELLFPLFIKPANMGSSVGISRVSSADGLPAAIEHALEFDHKVLVENGLENVLELECAVLGNERIEASVVGEIRSGAEFYDYAAKYVDDCSSVIIPAPISEQAQTKIQQLAVKAFQAIGGSGLARVDFFIDPDNEAVWINEINTLPGFTPISMYPKLWQASGLSYPELVDKLVALAIKRHTMKKSLKCSYTAPDNGGSPSI